MGSAAVFSTTWFYGTTPTAGTVDISSISGKVATDTIDDFDTIGMPGTSTGATGGVV
jgi:hypothetical protein